MAAASALWISSSYLLTDAQRVLARARGDVATAEAQRGAQEQLLQRQKLQESLAQRMRQAGLAPGQWNERRLNIQQVAMQRGAVRDVLADIAREGGRVFVADQFDISVGRPDEDLFTSPPPAAGGGLVTLSLRGQLFSREER